MIEYIKQLDSFSRLVAVLFLLLILYVIVSAIFYVRSAKRQPVASDYKLGAESESAGLQSYVRSHLDTLGVQNRGETMDGREIYAYDSKKMGF